MKELKKREEKVDDGNEGNGTRSVIFSSSAADEEMVVVSRGRSNDITLDDFDGKRREYTRARCNRANGTRTGK